MKEQTKRVEPELAPVPDPGDNVTLPEAVGFEGLPATVDIRQAGTIAAMAREEGEIKGAIVQAKHFPRDEMAAYTKILKSCERPSFAEGARYLFPRSGQSVEGPSVNLAREIARCWGNIRYSLRVVSLDEETVHIKGVAIDLESNNSVEMEDKFARLVYRKKGGWVKPDERDLRELINRRGAICVRNALLQLMPPDVVDDALAKAKETLTKAARGEIKQDPQAAARRIVLAFSELGVAASHIRQRLGHDIPPINEKELVDLRAIYNGIKDGTAKASDSFVMNGERAQSEGSAELNKEIDERSGGKSA